MQFIDATTEQPNDIGKLYTDRNFKMVGQAYFNSTTGGVTTTGIQIVITPFDGGAPAISVLPDSTYTIAVGSSLWVNVRRTAGTTNPIAPGDIQTFASRPTPRPDWVEIFYRSTTTELISFGNWIVEDTKGVYNTKLGQTKTQGVYDAIVGLTSPLATHTSIQQAITDVPSGGRILILEGTYTIASAGNPSASTSSAVAWSNKTLTIEGEGYNTVIDFGGGGLLAAFGITATAATTEGSKISNLRVNGFSQSVRLDTTTVGSIVKNTVIDVWHTGTTTASTPFLGATGTVHNAMTVERIQQSSAPTNFVRVGNYASASSSTLMRYEHRLDFTSRVRIGNTDNIGRLKLANYTTANRDALASPEEGESLYNTTLSTLDIRGAASWITFLPVPVGAYVVVGGTFSLANNGGTYQRAALAVTIPANYKLCDGTSIAAPSPFAGRFAPLINDDRFLRGVAADTGTTGGVNSVNLSHTHSYSHSHAFPHTHPIPASHSHTFAHSHTIASHNHAYAHSHYHDHTHSMFSHDHVHVWSQHPGFGRFYTYTSSSPNATSSIPVSASFWASDTAGGSGYGIRTFAGLGYDGTYYTTGVVNDDSGSTGLTNDPGNTGTSSPGTTSSTTTTADAIPAPSVTGSTTFPIDAASGPSAVSAPVSTASETPSLSAISVIPKYISCSVYLRIY